MATSSIRLNQELIDKAEIAANAAGRTIQKQIEHWANIGKMMEDNPELTYKFAKLALASKLDTDQLIKYEVT